MKNNSINRASIESDLNKHHVKYEDPLWDEEAYDYEVKRNLRISLRKTDYKDSDKAFEWDVFDKKILVLTVYGKDLSKKQVNYLLSADGMQHFMLLYKTGFRTQTKIKQKLKEHDFKSK